MILSDEARPMYHLSLFPEEMEHLHPLDLELEVCNVVPTSILQMLSLKINIVLFKRVYGQLSLELWLQAYTGLGFIYDDFLAAYVPSLVKLDPYARDMFGIDEKVAEFVGSPQQVLLVSAKAGACDRAIRCGGCAVAEGRLQDGTGTEQGRCIGGARDFLFGTLLLHGTEDRVPKVKGELLDLPTTLPLLAAACCSLERVPHPTPSLNGSNAYVPLHEHREHPKQRQCLAILTSFWTLFWSQNGPFSRRLERLVGTKWVTAGSKRAKKICLSIPSGLGTTLEKFMLDRLLTHR